MTRSEFPNEPGNYRVDNVEIFVFKGKIIVDTGNSNRSSQTGKATGKNHPAYIQTRSGTGKKKEKQPENPLDALSGARDFVLGNGKKGGGMFG